MTRNMAERRVIEHERIITTLPKAKNDQAVRREARDPGSRGSVASTIAGCVIRAGYAARTMTAKKLFDVLGPRFKDRPGGYCRVLKLSKPRLGDNGQRAILEFVERTPKEEAVEAEAGA